MADITNYMLTLNTDFTTKTSKILLNSLNFSLYSYWVWSCSTVAIQPPWLEDLISVSMALTHCVMRVKMNIFIFAL